MKARRATKYWTLKEDKFVISSILPMYIKSIYLGRSKNAIINRFRKLTKTQG